VITQFMHTWLIAFFASRLVLRDGVFRLLHFFRTIFLALFLRLHTLSSQTGQIRQTSQENADLGFRLRLWLRCRRSLGVSRFLCRQKRQTVSGLHREEGAVAFVPLRPLRRRP